MIAFFTDYLQHSKGRWGGEPFVPLIWQEKILRDVFGTLDDYGLRQYRKVYIEVPKKNGKSTLAAGVALYLLLADDEPTPEVYSAANAREQAKIVYDEARRMVLHNESLTNATVVYSSVSEIRRKKGGRYKALSKDSKNFHGLNPHGLIIDELHSFPDREMYDVLTQSSTTARAQPLEFVITTAGVDRTSLCWEKHQYALRVKNKEIGDDRFYPVIYGTSEEDEWTDPKTWRKANPSYSLFREGDIMKDCQEAQTSPSQENNFRRYRLNQWVKQTTRYIPMADYDDAPKRTSIHDLQVLYGGLDLASTRDLTAFVLVGQDSEGVYHTYPYFWCPTSAVEDRGRRGATSYPDWVAEGKIKATPGNVVDYRTIRDDIMELCTTHYVHRIGYDPFNAFQMVQDLSDSLDNDTLIPVRQNFGNLSAYTKELLRLVLSGKIAHGDNPVLRWNADNLIVHMGPTGNVLPKKQRNEEKIDGIVALIMAISMCVRFSTAAATLNGWNPEVPAW